VVDADAWSVILSRHLGRWQPRWVGHADGRPPEFYARRWGEPDWTITAGSAADLLAAVEAAECEDR
jgi:hypothetical protein